MLWIRLPVAKRFRSSLQQAYRITRSALPWCKSLHISLTVSPLSCTNRLLHRSVDRRVSLTRVALILAKGNPPNQSMMTTKIISRLSSPLWESTWKLLAFSDRTSRRMGRSTEWRCSSTWPMIQRLSFLRPLYTVFTHSSRLRELIYPIYQSGRIGLSVSSLHDWPSQLLNTLRTNWKNMSWWSWQICHPMQMLCEKSQLPVKRFLVEEVILGTCIQICQLFTSEQVEWRDETEVSPRFPSWPCQTMVSLRIV